MNKMNLNQESNYDEIQCNLNSPQYGICTLGKPWQMARARARAMSRKQASG